MFTCGLLVVLLSLCSWAQGSDNDTSVDADTLRAAENKKYLELCMKNYTSQNIIDITAYQFNSTCSYLCMGTNVTYEPADNTSKRYFSQTHEKECGLSCLYVSILPNMTCLSGECVYNDDIDRCGQKLQGNILKAVRLGFEDEKQCRINCGSDAVTEKKVVFRENGSTCYDWSRPSTKAWCGDDGKCRAYPNFVEGTDPKQICETRNRGKQVNVTASGITNETCDFYCVTSNATGYGYELLSLSDGTPCGTDGTKQCLDTKCLDKKIVAQCNSLPTAPKPVTRIDVKGCNVYCDGPAADGDKIDFNKAEGAACVDKTTKLAGKCDASGMCNTPPITRK